MRLFLSALLFLCLRADGQNKVIADISNFRTNKGVCRVCLFNDPSSFDGTGGKPFRCLSPIVSGNKVRVTFNDLPDGTYAIFVFHDANKNNKMDKNLLGIPAEGYGASRNKLPFAAAPEFKENAFILKNSSTTTVSIRLRNL